MPPMEPPGRVELPLAAYRAALAPERWWREDGDQPWDRTTFSRASAERYDHTSSLVVSGADAGSRTRTSCLRGRRAAGDTPSTWSRLEDSNLDSPVIGRTSCHWTKPGEVVPSAGVEPAWFRLKGGRIAALPRRDEAGCRAGIRTRIFPVNSRTCYPLPPPYKRPTRSLAGRRGFEPRFAASEAAVLPLDDLPMVGSGGLEPPRACARGRWATDYPTTRSTMG